MLRSRHQDKKKTPAKNIVGYQIYILIYTIKKLILYLVNAIFILYSEGNIFYMIITTMQAKLIYLINFSFGINHKQNLNLNSIIIY